MSISNYIDGFLAGSKQGRSSEYKFKLIVFHEFLEGAFDTTDSNYLKIIGGLDLQDILCSIDYYVSRKGVRKISYCSPVRVYFSAIREFMKYLNHNSPVKNELFDSRQKENELRTVFESKLKQLNLKDSEADVHITQEECKELIEKCDMYITFITDDELTKNDAYNSSYKKFLSSILLKLIVFSGASLETLNKLTLSDYDDDLNRLRINGYNIHLPDNLAKQIKTYLKIRESVCADGDTERLFIKRRANSDKRSAKSSQLYSTDICEVLKEVTGRNSVRSASKYAIIEMIKLGIPQHLIMDFTGYKDEVYGYCLDIANEEVYVSGSRLLDSKLRSFEIFEKL